VNCETVERDLDAYVDRELGSDSATAILEHVSACVACRRRVGDRKGLSRLIGSAPYFAAPDRLRASVSAGAAGSTAGRGLLAWAAAAVLAVSVGGGIWLVQSVATHANATVDEVVNEHVRSLMAEHLFDVRSTDQHAVKPWFLGKLDFSPPVADLASIGFPLVGGRLDYLGGRPVAALVYQRQKHTINVFVFPDRERAFAANATRSLRGFHVHHWIREGMSFWAVSDLNDAELSEFTHALQTS
jgi:anti-sigma factor RsiW